MTDYEGSPLRPGVSRAPIGAQAAAIPARQPPTPHPLVMSHAGAGQQQSRQRSSRATLAKVCRAARWASCNRQNNDHTMRSATRACPPWPRHCVTAASISDAKQPSTTHGARPAQLPNAQTHRQPLQSELPSKKARRPATKIRCATWLSIVCSWRLCTRPQHPRQLHPEHRPPAPAVCCAPPPMGPPGYGNAAPLQPRSQHP